jgi:hypothetical protein
MLAGRDAIITHYTNILPQQMFYVLKPLIVQHFESLKLASASVALAP